MRFFQTVISGAALIAAAFALEINEFPSGGVVAGQTYTVTYSPKDNTPTTFVLRQGDSGDLKTISTLTTTATGGSFSWTVDKSLTDESDYALEIKQGDVINYSAQFPLSGGSGEAISSAVSSAYASASSAAASAASSASAALSSAISSAVASASISPSAGTNTTVTSATLSRSATSTKSTASATSSGGVPESTGAASSLATSPLAALFGAIAAFAYLA
ncbi:Nn.00g054290.m01.CDS01 [Neocucurbitaria sp. VM-36]